jgi:hypothetical protein
VGHGTAICFLDMTAYRTLVGGSLNDAALLLSGQFGGSFGFSGLSFGIDKSFGISSSLSIGSFLLRIKQSFGIGSSLLLFEVQIIKYVGPYITTLSCLGSSSFSSYRLLRLFRLFSFFGLLKQLSSWLGFNLGFGGGFSGSLRGSLRLYGLFGGGSGGGFSGGRGGGSTFFLCCGISISSFVKCFQGPLNCSHSSVTYCAGRCSGCAGNRSDRISDTPVAAATFGSVSRDGIANFAGCSLIVRSGGISSGFAGCSSICGAGYRLVGGSITGVRISWCTRLGGWISSCRRVIACFSRCGRRAVGYLLAGAMIIISFMQDAFFWRTGKGLKNGSSCGLTGYIDPRPSNISWLVCYFHNNFYSSLHYLVFIRKTTFKWRG